MPPTNVIEDDASGDVETSGVFDPSSDGIDFYESLEAMLLQVNNPVVVGPRNGFGEVWVLADDGANAFLRTTREGILVRGLGSAPYPHDYEQGDFNPERIQLQDGIFVGPMPGVNVGDHLTSPAVGVPAPPPPHQARTPPALASSARYPLAEQSGPAAGAAAAGEAEERQLD